MASIRKAGLRLIQGGGSAQPQSGFVKAHDGTKIYFQDSGGKGVPLVFIYGLGCSIQHWKYPLAALAHEDDELRGYRCIWSDIRGHGRSAMPPKNKPIRLDDVINDQMAVLSHLQVNSAVFLGQSMGGCVAMEIAHRFPESTAGLVLLGSPARSPAHLLPFQPLAKYLWDSMISVNRTVPFAVRLLYKRLIPLVQKKPVQLLLREMIRQKGFNAKLAKTSDIEEYIDVIFKIHPNIFYQMAATLDGYDAGKYNGTIKAPTLILAGAQDQIIPTAEAEFLHRQIQNSKLELIPHGSHCPHFDDPVLVSGLIRQFLAREEI